MARAASACEPAPVGGAASATPCCCSGLVRRVPQGGLIGQKLFKCRWIRAVCVPTIPAPMRLSCVTPILAPMRCFCLTKVFGAVASVSPVSQSCDRASALNQQKSTSHKNKNADRKRLFLFPVLATGVRLWPSTIVSVRPSPLVCQTVSVRPSPLFSFFSFFSKWLSISKKPLGFFSTPENKQGSFLIPKPNNTREWRNPKSARGTIAYYTANLNAKLFYSCLVSKLHHSARWKSW